MLNSLVLLGGGVFIGKIWDKGCRVCGFLLIGFVQSLSHIQLHGLQDQASLSFIIFQSLLKLMSIESVMSSNHLILCYTLLLLPSIRVFSNESALCIRWPKYWSFSFSINPFNEYSGLISFRIDRFYLFSVRGTFKSLLQHHSSKAPVPWYSAFFMVQLSYSHMTTGKTMDLTIQTLVGKVMSLLFNMLSSFVIALWTFKAVKILFSLQPPHRDQQMFPGQNQPLGVSFSCQCWPDIPHSVISLNI